MKRRSLVTAAAALGAALLLSLPFSPVTYAAESEARTTLAIKGMTCGGCVASVKLQLKRTTGVTAYEVSLERAEADVAYDASLTTPDAIAAAVSKTGFTATVKTPADDAEKKGGR